VNAVKPANYTKVKAQELQDKLYLAAKENPKRRFHALYDKIYREDILLEAWRRVKGNKGSGGIDGVTIDHIVEGYGEERFVEEIRDQLICLCTLLSQKSCIGISPMQRGKISLKPNNTGKYPVENGIYQLSAQFCWILVDKIQSNGGRPHSSGDLTGQIPM
jgi:hypothetical protein